jgi:hypothetical protein
MGVGASPRVIENRLSLFNNERQLVLLTESTNAPGGPLRTASRTAVGERSFTTQVPPLPGFPPPDPFLAIKRVRIMLRALPTRVGRRRAAYIKTPPMCPASGGWVNAATFTYRDGEAQTVESRSPCIRDAEPPRIRIRGLPRRCASSSFTLRVGIRDASALRSTRVFLDRRRIVATKRKRFSKRIPASRLSSGGHRVKVTATDTVGNRATRAASFRRCTSPRRLSLTG